METAEKIAYVDASSGVSGDMLVGALIDLGVPLERIIGGLGFLPGVSISTRQVKRLGLRATKFDVELNENSHQYRKWSDVQRQIGNAPLSEKIRDRGLCIFRALFEAEAFVHGTLYDETHLHELSAADCMADVFGFLIAADYLGIEHFFVSAVNVGSGSVNTRHGLLTVPAPAVAELLKGFQVYSSAPGAELATPTGAAILKIMARPLSSIPELSLEGVGSGAGDMELIQRPNVLRMFLGKAGLPESGEVMVVETNIDDMSPQFYGHVSEELFKAGALDVFTTAITMKKGRPATKLSVIVPLSGLETICGCIFDETTSIGLRYYPVRRETLPRSIRKIDTPYGEVRVKVATRNDRTVNVAPEYEDLRKLAREHSIPLKKLLAEVNRRIDSF